MVTETIPALKSLPLAKKRRLISELVDEVYGEPVREAELADALARRIARAQRKPTSLKAWDDVKSRLRKKG